MIRVSVCIATYNGEKYIKDQIDSIITQLTEEDEIIVSDDYSTDTTINILKQYNDNRIKIFLNDGEKGSTGNFENALKKSQGQYIFLSDQDDIWLSNKVTLTLKFLISDNYDMVISDCTVVDQDMNTIVESYFAARGSKNRFINTLIKANYLGCCMAFNRNLLKESIPFPKNHRLLPHDLWLGLIGYAFFKVKMMDEKLILYRRHENNVSNGGMKSNTSIKFKMQFRAYAFINILKKIFIDK